MVVTIDCEEDEKVGVIKCGDFDLAESSFWAGFFADVGESRD